MQPYWHPKEGSGGERDEWSFVEETKRKKKNGKKIQRERKPKKNISEQPRRGGRQQREGEREVLLL